MDHVGFGSRSVSALGTSVLLVAAALSETGCGKKADTNAEHVPVTRDSATEAPRPAPSASGSANAAGMKVQADEAKKPLETWGFQAVPKLSEADDLYPIENAVIVSAKYRLGRITDDEGTVEWLGRVPDGNPAIGPTRILGVYGVAPKDVDVRYQWNNGRAPEPTYFPLSGKGHSVITGEGGMYGYISGIARVRDTTILGTYGRETGHVLRTVRGPKLVRKLTTAKEAGCTAAELGPQIDEQAPKAIGPNDLAGNDKGELFSVGELCEKRGPAVERWDAEGKATILPIPWKKERVRFARFLRGKGDKLWLFGTGELPLLEYRDGAFVALSAAFPDASAKPFVSLEGELYAYTDEGVFRLDETKTAFVPVAKLQYPKSILALTKAGDTFWVNSRGRVGKLVPAASVDRRDDCPTPFVDLYRVSDNSDAKFTFPTTQKALASFPERDAIALVDSEVEGVRRLGVVVTSNAQGEALIAHLATTMKDEHPTLMCYQPKNPRVIPPPAKK